MRKINLLQLREAIEKSWGPDTSYKAMWDPSNKSLGQCYPTSRTINYFFPEAKIIKGKVWDGENTQTHFWNVIHTEELDYYIDFSWQQFPVGSSVKEFGELNEKDSSDSEGTIIRCETLLKRVMDNLPK